MTSRSPYQSNGNAQDHVSTCQVILFPKLLFLVTPFKVSHTVYCIHKLSNTGFICRSDSPLAADRAINSGFPLAMTYDQIMTRLCSCPALGMSTVTLNSAPHVSILHVSCSGFLLHLSGFPQSCKGCMLTEGFHFCRRQYFFPIFLIFPHDSKN